MKQKRATVVVVALLVATATRAQIGRDRTGCLQVWGEPVAGQVVSNGIGTLTFTSEDCAVELGFVDGIVRHAVYRKPSMDQKEVDHLLNINSENGEWTPWTPPGRRAEKDKVSQWMRSDEMAMATLARGVLTVVGGEWNQRLSMPPAEPPAAQPTGSHQGAKAETQAFSAPDDIAGFWEARRPDAPTGCVASAEGRNDVVDCTRDHRAARLRSSMDSRSIRRPSGVYVARDTVFCSRAEP